MKIRDIIEYPYILFHNIKNKNKQGIITSRYEYTDGQLTACIRPIPISKLLIFYLAFLTILVITGGIMMTIILIVQSL